MKNSRTLLLLAAFLVSVAAGAWMIKGKLASAKKPPEPEGSPRLAEMESPAATRPPVTPPPASTAVLAAPPVAPGPPPGLRPPFSASRTQETAPVPRGKTTGAFQSVRYVDGKGQSVTMNEEELRDLGEPPPGAYDQLAVQAYLGRLKETGKYRKLNDLGLQPIGPGPNHDLVIELDPENLLAFTDTPIAELLDFYSDLKGVNLIRDSSIAAGTKLTVTSKWPLSRQEAIRLFETTFLLNSFYLVAVGDRSVKVLQAPKDPKQEGIALVRDLDDLIGGEVISSFVLKLKWIEPEAAKNILIESFGNLHSYGKIVPVPSVGELVITENSELIRRMKDLLDVVDRPPAEVKRIFVKLNQANADRVAELIMQILESRQKASQGGVTASAGGGARPGAGPSATPAVQTRPPVVLGGAGTAGAAGTANITASEKDLVSGEVQLIPDVRTNRILVVGSPRNVDYIEKLIGEFDVVVELSEPYEQPLNYVSAAEMLPILADLLQEEEGDGGVTGGDATGAATRTTTGGLGAVSSPTGSTSANQGISGAGQLGTLQEPGEEQAAQSVIVGKTRLIADNRANSILVIGQPEARKKVKAILDKLDKKPMQVYLATVIGDLTVGNNDEFAVNILQKYMGSPSNGAASVAGGKPFISSGTNGLTPLSPEAATLAQMAQVATASLPGIQVATFFMGAIDVYIKALTATSRFRVASRPSIFTANNKKAVIFNGRKIAVPTSTVTTLGAGGSSSTTTGSQQSNIQYQDVVLKIEVVPLINSAREITLQIIQTNDNIIPGATTDIGGGVSVPEISTQELTTTVNVPDRSTILLGGLITQRDAKVVDGVPFLSSVPLMGNLFKSTVDSTNRQELVVLIQPSVIQDTLELREVSKTERDLTEFSAKELSPLSMKFRSGKDSANLTPEPSLNGLPETPSQE